jgi:hypothetical protein
MIGPEKGTVEVIPHYASWRYAFEQKRPVLQEHIGDHGLDIEDVGGTGEGAAVVAVVRGGAGSHSGKHDERITIGLSLRGIVAGPTYSDFWHTRRVYDQWCGE